MSKVVKDLVSTNGKHDILLVKGVEVEIVDGKKKGKKGIISFIYEENGHPLLDITTPKGGSITGLDPKKCLTEDGIAKFGRF